MDDSKDNPQFDLFGALPAPDGAPQTSGEPENIELARAGTTPPAKGGRRARPVLPATCAPELTELAQSLPPHVHLGTSSWSFPGWEGIVYGEAYSDSKLSRDGLTAYGAHPLLRTVSLDRSFYAPLSIAEYLRYAQQVPDDFRFIVKAPASVTDATVRGERGEPLAERLREVETNGGAARGVAYPES